MALVPIEVPADVPCPQASEVSPIERRLSSSALTYTARTIEIDERQYQSLGFVMSAAQAASFRVWWRDVLHFGGAWFAAPATWPTPAGLVVKVRRFASAPLWSYASVGYWRVTIDCEVRGESDTPLMESGDALPVGWNVTNGVGTWSFAEANYLGTLTPDT